MKVNKVLGCTNAKKKFFLKSSNFAKIYKLTVELNSEIIV